MKERLFTLAIMLILFLYLWGWSEICLGHTLNMQTLKDVSNYSKLISDDDGSYGSGLVLTLTLTLTNKHVCKTSDQLKVSGKTVTRKWLSKKFDLCIVEHSPRLKTITPEFTTILSSQQKVFVAGYPEPFMQLTTCTGIVLRFSITMQHSLGSITGILVSNKVRPGYSGSPAFNFRGQIIGLTTGRLNPSSFGILTPTKDILAFFKEIKFNWGKTP